MTTRRLSSALCVMCAAHLLAIPAHPRAQATPPPETRATRVENVLLPGIVIAGRPLPARPLADRMAALKTPGVSVAVIGGGVIEWAKGYGVVEAGRGAVVMTNGDQGGRLASEVLRAVAAEYDWPARRPRVKTVATVDPSALATLAGRYELRPGRVLTVALEGGTLVVIDGMDRVELFPESATRFFETVQESEIEFVKGPDGSISHMLLNGQQQVPRLPQPPAIAPSTM